MAFVLADRVKETTTTTGTGTVTLAGAATGYQSFSAVGNGNSTYYAIAGQTTSEWEVGIGTYTSAGTTLSRTTVLASSNGGSLVTFSAGTKDVFVTYPAGRSVNVDSTNTVVSVPQLSATSISDSGNLTFTGTGNRITGDFSNATIASRVAFQTSTVNGNTSIYTIPNGTGTISGLVAYSNSDPTNASSANFAIVGANDARIQSAITGTGTYLPMTFYTGGSERMRLDTSGNVGIGGTPAYKLDVTSSAFIGGRLSAATGTNGVSQIYTNTGGTFSIGIDASTGANFGAAYGGFLWHAGAYPLLFGTSNTERMRITGDGNVGIGTSSPSAKLDITGSGGVISKFQNFAGSSGIDSYVAEGTSAAPTALISGRQIMNYRSYGYDGASYIFVGGIDMQAESAFSVGTNPTYLRFRTSPSSGTGTERMRIDSSGKLLVGTSSVLGAAADAVQILQSGSPGIAIGTSTTPTSNASIAGINAYGNDGSTYVVGGTINFRAAENWSTTNHGTDMQFRVTASGSGGALAEAMRIASTGYVGIGTSAPTVPLNVVSSSAVTAGQPSIILQGSNNTERLGIRSTSASVFITQFANGTLASPTAVTTDNFLGGYQFGGYAATLWTRGAQLAGYAAGTWTDTSTPAYIVFQTVPSGSTGLLERMRIDSSGNVGIGTSSPGAKLHVYTGSITDTSLFVNNSYTGSTGGIQITQKSTGEGQLFTFNAQPLLFGTSNTERMRIDSSGNVGIGTSSPTANNRLTLSDTNSSKLTLTGGSTQNGMLFNVVSTSNQYYIGAGNNLLVGGDKGFLIYDVTNARAKFFVEDTAGETRTLATTFLSYYTGGSERMRIGSTGNVGIGTSASAYGLSVNTSSGVNSYDAAANKGRFVLGDPADATGYIGIYRSAAATPGTGGNDLTVASYNTIAFTTGAASFASQTERMRIDSSGNVGIGTSSPVNKFAVVGDVAARAFTTADTAYVWAQVSDFWTTPTYTGAAMVAKGSAATGTSAGVVNANQTGFYFQNSQNVLFNSNNSINYVFAINGTERMRIDTSGNVGIGTSSPSSSAILDAQSTTKGVRMPNMTTTQKNAISSPAAGLMVFDTTLAKLCVYSGSAWQTITSI